jgi:neurofibromin 1
VWQLNYLVSRIVTQQRLSWWPQIDLVYARSGELRALFTDTLNKATQGYIAHTPLRMITSLALKSKDAQSRDGKFAQNLNKVT